MVLVIFFYLKILCDMIKCHYVASSYQYYSLYPHCYTCLPLTHTHVLSRFYWHSFLFSPVHSTSPSSSTCSLLSLQIIVSSVNITDHKAFCVTITFPNRKGLRWYHPIPHPWIHLSLILHTPPLSRCHNSVSTHTHTHNVELVPYQFKDKAHVP